MPYRKALLPSNDISSSRVSTPRAPGAFPGSSRSAVPPSKAGAQTGSDAGHCAERGSRRLPSVPALRGSRAPQARRGGGMAPREPRAPAGLSAPGNADSRRQRPGGGSPVTGAASGAAGPRATSGRCDPPCQPAERTGRPRPPHLPSRAAAASSPRAMSGCGNGARRQRARAEGGRGQGAAAAAPRSGRSGDGPAGHVTADVTRPARPSREAAGAVREGGISRERGRGSRGRAVRAR